MLRLRLGIHFRPNREVLRKCVSSINVHSIILRPYYFRMFLLRVPITTVLALIRNCYVASHLFIC
ncbi:hypothetical protein BDZ91DRAFT_314398 [Kalaharituber pfeilii]|nr:hypothetical protein BDZ91DRAFT_314398 [Kalaharituber pfeilii]